MNSNITFWYSFVISATTFFISIGSDQHLINAPSEAKSQTEMHNVSNNEHLSDNYGLLVFQDNAPAQNNRVCLASALILVPVYLDKSSQPTFIPLNQVYCAEPPYRPLGSTFYPQPQDFEKQ